MKLSAMTLGCPAWDLPTLLKNAKAYGFDGIDFRGLQADLDITKTPAFTAHLAATAKQIREAGLEVSGISSSLQVCDPTKRSANLEEAKRTIPVALALGAKNVRVFGGGPIDKMPRTELAAIGRDTVNEILALPDAAKLSWNFETHDNWISSADCLLLLNAVPNPAFGALWDMGHTYAYAGEPPEKTYAAIGPRVRYTHVKDSIKKPATADKKEGWQYVLPGLGVLPLAASIKLLQNGGYDGWLLFEHEKRWHPDLPDPEIAFPAFIKWARPLL